MPALNILIKPASGNCNIKCKYCFYRALDGDHAKFPKEMLYEIVDVLLKKALDFADGYLSIAFQGGEPTLLGVEYFERFVETANRYNRKGVKINYAIQTNGLLFDEKWATFLKENDFLVGISLDGIMKSHDKFRVDYQGNPTFSKVLQKIRLLQRYGVKFNVLTVLNAETVKYPEEMYRFYSNNGFKYVQFLECLDPLGVACGVNDYSLDNDAYADFLIKYFDLWYADLKKGVVSSVNVFENYLAIIAKGSPFDCGMWGFCSAQFIFETDGSVYPCDFYVQDRWKIGNILTDDFRTMKDSMTASSFETSSYSVADDCVECKYLKLCRGGCRRAKDNPDKKGMNRFCSAYKKFFDSRLDQLVEIVNLYGLRK